VSHDKEVDPMPIAHAKWFVEDPAHHQADWGFLMDPLTLTMLFASIALAALAAVVTRRLPSGLLPGLSPPARLAGAMPRLLAVVVGITLPILAASGWLLVPGASLDGVPGQDALLIAEALLGLWLVSGVGVRRAAGALGALCAILAVTSGPVTLLEGAYVPAIALYLALGSGAGEAAERRAALAWRVLAVAVGVALIAAAFTEKLVAPTIMLSVLRDYPALDILSTIGVASSDMDYVRLMGSVEVLLGLLIATGIGGRVVPLSALGAFLVTVPIFGPVELIGHLPVCAALIAVATRPVTVDAVAGAWPAPIQRWSRRAGARVALGSPGP
jgi:hypothetical protein